MSRRLPWYKRDVDAWRGGTRGMSLELRGFYSECLDAMWDLQGPIPADPERLAMMICCNPRTVRKLLPQLVDLGKLELTPEGYTNPRMQGEIIDANSPANRGEFGSNSGGIRGEFGGNSGRIRGEFDARNPKNPMISTRDLEEGEEEKDKGGVRARDAVTIRRDGVEIGEAVAADLLSYFPGVDLKAVAVRAAVELNRQPNPPHATRLAIVRRCALFEAQATRPRSPTRAAGKLSVLDIVRGDA